MGIRVGSNIATVRGVPGPFETPCGGPGTIDPSPPEYGILITFRGFQGPLGIFQNPLCNGIRVPLMKGPIPITG